MKLVEDTYSAIAEKMLATAEVNNWIHLELRTKILTSMVGSEFLILPECSHDYGNPDITRPYRYLLHM